ncbi:hypothetical protein MBM_05027 [Drepanopeziza brunnea f. sp. 'multigermtubi' MB_m1]|uniref:Uncharacterized protein n=1 Tax=Marssonina brunnea f. sp. multigermtubi (strain MB_m1) TaxID=1072389 RepID=K1X7C9_MARBU|nr:uncharacterized protein MBM_05027 [Drepanopeziza brunnea f. sp. 'multigermtubi' MB_m1]EKD16558.1 hypothetical protein MBM_05027 [Drepanopeziza brunnea f. sp. 'multigermtubi' MB_m1]
MATYGKKKRSLFPSFSALRDSDAEFKPKKGKENTQKRGSIAFTAPPIFYDSNYKEESPSNPHDDSIDEMASMLLEDTEFDQLKPEAGKRASYSAASRTLPGPPRMGLQDSKTLPQLPSMIFNGDDAWALRMSSVVTAVGSSNQMDFGAGGPSNKSDQNAGHTRKTSTPAIPRKSSKRRSARPRSALFQAPPEVNERRSQVSRHTLKSSISPPQPQDIPLPIKTTAFDAVDVNSKIEAMIAATKALKPGCNDSVPQGVLVPVKKRRFESKVLTKMKTALNGRFQVRNGRKRDSMLNERLLDTSLNEALDFEDESSASAVALTTMELRMNEGDNFKNPKIYTLTGHGNVRRKPLADDGKSLRSRKSTERAEDPFAERPSSGITRTPTSFENRLNDSPQGSEFVPDLPSLCHTPNNKAREKRVRTSLYGRDHQDFDAMLSSSPFGQSTPRIRLEPTFDADGKRSLSFVPAESRSLFDPENSSMDIDTSDHLRRSSSSREPMKRSYSNTRPREYRASWQSSKRMKKHPSPSKADLEELEKDLQNFLPCSSPGDQTLEEDKFPMDRTLTPASALSPTDANKKLLGSRRRQALNVEPMKTIESMPNLPSRPKYQPPSLQPRKKTVEGLSRQFMSCNNMADDRSIMDIDELQWDNAAYNIGLKRV